MQLLLEILFLIGNPGKISEEKYNLLYLRNGRL